MKARVSLEKAGIALGRTARSQGWFHTMFLQFSEDSRTAHAERLSSGFTSSPCAWAGEGPASVLWDRIPDRARANRGRPLWSSEASVRGRGWLVQAGTSA